MTWKELLEKRIVVRHKTAKGQIDEFRGFIRQNLRDASFKALSLENRFNIAFHAAILTAKLAVFCAGYRLKAGRSLCCLQSNEARLGFFVTEEIGDRIPRTVWQDAAAVGLRTGTDFASRRGRPLQTNPSAGEERGCLDRQTSSQARVMSIASVELRPSVLERVTVNYSGSRTGGSSFCIRVLGIGRRIGHSVARDRRGFARRHF